MKRLSKLLAIAAAALLLVGCLSSVFKLGSAVDPPLDVKVLPGDTTATVTWTNVPGVQYWLFTAQASDVSTSNWDKLSGGRAMINVTSPVLLTGLVNGLTYSFTVNGRTDDGPGGGGSPSLSIVPRLAGGTWNKGAPLANDLRGVVFGTMFVAVGTHGALYSSLDFNAWTPIAWTPQPNPLATLADLNAAVYGYGIYLAAGAGGVLLYSTDTLTWTAQNSGTTNNLLALATNAVNEFVAVGEKGTIIVSSDGKTWTAVNSGTANDLFGVTYGNGVFMAVGANGTLLSSVDGSTWVAVASNTLRNLKSIAFGVNAATSTYQFIAVGDSGNVVTSTDGTTWVAQTPFTTNNLNAIVYNRQFVVVGDSGALFTSLDGSSWQAQVSGTTNNLSAITHNIYGFSTVGMAGTNLSSL